MTAPKKSLLACAGHGGLLRTTVGAVLHWWARHPWEVFLLTPFALLSAGIAASIGNDTVGTIGTIAGTLCLLVGIASLVQGLRVSPRSFRILVMVVILILIAAIIIFVREVNRDIEHNREVRLQVEAFCNAITLGAPIAGIEDRATAQDLGAETRQTGRITVYQLAGQHLWRCEIQHAEGKVLSKRVYYSGQHE